MCQDTGISPQHNRVLLIGNVALFFETGYLIFNLGVIILFSKYASITSDSGTSRRLDALMGAPSPVMWIDEQMKFEMVPYYDFASRSLQTDTCPFKNPSSEAAADAAFTACCKSCQKTFLDAKGELNVDIASTLTGMVTACILGMVANLLIFIGLCALTCCCCSQNRTNPESCWWKYTAINCLLGVAVMAYPLIYFTDLTTKLGTFKDCITELNAAGCGSELSSAKSALDSVHTVFIVLTVIYYLMMFLRLALGGLGCCLPKGAQAGGSMQNNFDDRGENGGQMGYSGEMVAGTNKV